MRSTIYKTIYLVYSALSVSATAQSLPPRIFFSDLESGPGSGGEAGKGAFVTIYGRNFGATPASSTVTVGGGNVGGYPVWSDRKITVQLGPEARTGDIVVTTAVGTSNGVEYLFRGHERQ